MKAFLSRVIRLNNEIHDANRIIMYFKTNMEDSKEYSFITTIETQFDLGIRSIDSEEDVECYLKKLNCNIGKVHEINLYEITVEEMTDKKYVSIIYGSDENIIQKYYRASYKIREDVLFDIKRNVCINCLGDNVYGVKQDGKQENIENPKDIFFGELHRCITKEMLNKVRLEYVLNSVDMNYLKVGRVLVDPKEYINCRDVFKLVEIIELYRKKKYEVSKINSSWRKKLLFWQKPESFPQIDITKEEEILLRKAYIYGTEFKEDCFDKIESNFSKNNSGNIKKSLFDEAKRRNRKYKGMCRIKVVG